MGPPRQHSRDPHQEDVIEEIVRNALALEGAGAPSASRPRESRTENRTENRTSVRIARVPPAAPRVANPVAMHPAAAALFAAPTLIREIPRKRVSHALHVVKGLHLGARTPLAGSNMLVIGSGEDCDVILADEGVSAHHCVLTCQEGKPVVRVMDGVLTLEGREHAPGTVISLSSGAMVELGAAAFEVTSSLDVVPDADKKSPKVAGKVAPAAPAPPQGWPQGWPAWQERGARILVAHRWGLGATGVVAVACMLGAVAFGFATHSKPAVVSPPQTVVKTEARPGPAIARDVVEVLRLSGIASQGSYLSEGTVTVTGHLGDPHALEAIIQSRAMGEIVGLKRVVVTNLDYPGASGSGTPVDGTRIVSAIDGKDPYVVTGDGSRYYVGATLPQGGKLVGVQAGAILVERDGKVEHQKVGAPGADGS
jgi:Inner membrane component of T3SS, cytoplasmic domain